MSNNPSNITSGKICISLVNVHDMVHSPVQSNSRSPMIPHNSFRSSSRARSIKDIEIVRTSHFFGRYILEFKFAHLEFLPLRTARNVQIRSLIDEHCRLMICKLEGFSQNLNIVDLLIRLQSTTCCNDYLWS